MVVSGELADGVYCPVRLEKIKLLPVLGRPAINIFLIGLSLLAISHLERCYEVGLIHPGTPPD
jgi:hypothetical protein